MNIFNVYPKFDVSPVRGEGSYIWGKDGSKYLDFYGGHAVISIGHNHPHYLKRIQDQLRKLGFYSNAVQNDLQTKFAFKLGRLSKYNHYKLFLCNSGAEANENALKIAAFYNKRNKIIAFRHGFHGRTSLAAGATDNPKIRSSLNRHSVKFLPLNDLEQITCHLQKKDVCAVIVEGIQGVGGAFSPNKDFLKRLSKLCKRNGTVLILDEIQSGYGRSGKFFAHQYTSVQPDIISTAKGMGNGFPIGGVLIHPRFKAEHGMLGTTFGGNHLACSAGIAVLDVIQEEKLMKHVQTIGGFLKKELESLNSIREVRGRGLMLGVNLDRPAKVVRKKLLIEKKVFTGGSSQGNTLRLLPPLTINRRETEEFIYKINEVLKN